MADSNVDITQGTGTSIDTRTESTNGNHRQVVTIGDPANNDGVAPVDGTAGVKVDLGADNDIKGGTAPDAAIANAPVTTGGRASTAIPTAMSTDGDVVNNWNDRNGATVVRQRPAGTATLANVSASATSVTLRAANTSRLGLIIFNDSTEILYVKFGSTASATSFTYKLNAGDTLELQTTPYTGIVTGIWVSATGTARVTELT